MIPLLIGATNGKIQSISYPIIRGGPSVMAFTSTDILAFGTYVTAVESEVDRFQGHVTKRSHKITVNESKVYEYVAVCKSYFIASAEDVNIINYLDTEENFSGNGVEYQDWLLREEPQKHVTWPPTGDIPIIFDEVEETEIACPANRISIGETEENTLPSHVKIEVKKYREKRFPVLPDFKTDVQPTKALLETPDFADYGRKFKVMQPEDPTEEFLAAPLENAKVGGSKFAIFGDLAEPYPRDQSLVVSASLNPKKTGKILQKVGGPAIPPVLPPSPVEFRNSVKANMKFFHGVLLPRVTGEHGPGVGKQQCYVRARYLEELLSASENIGGINKQDKIGSLDHVEIEVSYDTFDGSKFRDFTFGGPKGLLHETDDEGEGVWLSDLSGTYIETEGIEKANGMLAKALAHYENIRLQKDIQLAGINWTYIYKLLFGIDIFFLDSIEWKFGIQAEQNRTQYSGVRIRNGFSHSLARKKRWLERAERKKDDEKARRAPAPDNKQGEGVQATKEFARIAWILSWSAPDIIDESEGEIMVDSTGWTPTGQAIWIDYEKSENVSCHTGGDNTIFQVEKIQSGVVRGTTTRDLYRAVAVENPGIKITHLYTTSKEPLLGKLASQDLSSQKIWLEWEQYGEGNAAVQTTILSVKKTNIRKAILSDSWDLGGIGDFQWLENVSWEKNQYKPVSPVVLEPDTQYYESSEKKLDGITTIATYLGST